MSLIIPANTLASGGYAVDNSLRFNDDSSDNLNKTYGSSGNMKTWTLSTWIKRSNLSANSSIFTCEGLGIAAQKGTIRFDSSDKISAYVLYSGTWYYITSDAVFRDVSAWYHIIVRCDTTQITDTDRLRLYVNGTLQTLSSSNYPSQNADTFFNEAEEHQIGSLIDETEDFDGYMSEFNFIDGQSLDPTSFGEFDADTGIWKPIDVSGLTFGTNGFYLDFQDSAALGDDVSGNGNDFTVNNLTAVDQSTDTPTNNFATLNALALTTRQTLSDGNLTGTSSSWSSAISTIAITTGKWFAEVKYVDSTGNILVGVMDEKDMSSLTGSTAGLGFTTNSVGYYATGVRFIADSSSSYGASYTANDIIGIALDLDSGTKTVTFYKNGASQGAINLPTTGTGTFFIGTSSTSNGISSINFGSPAFTISSGNSDGNGYGNFEYSVPSGYYALNTKNLAEYG